MLKLKLQYFGLLMRRADSLEKTLMLGKIEDRRRRGWQRMRWLDGITNSMDMSLSRLRQFGWTGRPGVLQSMGFQRVGHDWATELSWTRGLFVNNYWANKQGKKNVIRGKISRAELLQLPVEITPSCATRLLGWKAHIRSWSDSLTICKAQPIFPFLELQTGQWWVAHPPQNKKKNKREKGLILSNTLEALCWVLWFFVSGKGHQEANKTQDGLFFFSTAFLPVENLSSSAHPLFFTPPSPHGKATSSPESCLSTDTPFLLCSTLLLSQLPAQCSHPGSSILAEIPPSLSSLDRAGMAKRGHLGRRQEAVTGVVTWEHSPSGPCLAGVILNMTSYYYHS